MGDCEICGKMSVSTMKVTYHKSKLEACTICSQKMNLIPVRNYENKAVKNSNLNNRKKITKSNISNKKLLIENFHKKIAIKRKSNNMSKAELAKKANVRLIDIQNIESGKILEDKVVQKIEKALAIQLFTDEAPLDVRRVKSTRGSGMTLGDYFNNRG